MKIVETGFGEYTIHLGVYTFKAIGLLEKAFHHSPRSQDVSRCMFKVCLAPWFAIPDETGEVCLVAHDFPSFSLQTAEEVFPRDINRFIIDYLKDRPRDKDMRLLRYALFSRSRLSQGEADEIIGYPFDPFKSAYMKTLLEKKRKIKEDYDRAMKIFDIDVFVQAEQVNKEIIACLQGEPIVL